MRSKETLENVMKAEAFIAEQVNDFQLTLESWSEVGAAEHRCGSIACAGGHLAYAEEFGLSMRRRRSWDLYPMPYYVVQESEREYFGFPALEAALRLEATDAVDLFGIKGKSSYDLLLDAGLSDKARFLARCDLFLREHGGRGRHGCAALLGYGGDAMSA